jgi:hypothetical protein
MIKCPDCMKEVSVLTKKWKYGSFDVEAYSCECGTDFRSYKNAGKEVFKLKKDKKDGRFRKP